MERIEDIGQEYIPRVSFFPVIKKFFSDFQTRLVATRFPEKCLLLELLEVSTGIVVRFAHKAGVTLFRFIHFG